MVITPSSSFTVMCILGKYASSSMTQPRGRLTTVHAGAPGSGKGTLGRMLADDFGVFHLSVGDHIREIVKDAGHDEHETIHSYLRQGKLLPLDTIVPLLKRKMEVEVMRGQSRFLIDGFPREQSQGRELEKQVCESCLQGPAKPSDQRSCMNSASLSHSIARKIPLFGAS